MSLLERYPDFRPRSLNARFERWMYPNGRPNRLARLRNRFWAIARCQRPAAPAARDPRGHRPQQWATLSFPLVIADLEGERYLVAMLGEGSKWVPNVRASGGRAVLHHGRREGRLRLEEARSDRRALDRAPKPGRGAADRGPSIPVDPSAPVEASCVDRWQTFLVSSGGGSMRSRRGDAQALGAAAAPSPGVDNDRTTSPLCVGSEPLVREPGGRNGRRQARSRAPRQRLRRSPWSGRPVDRAG